MNILGISAYYHDAAACLLQDGKVIAAAQEERFTRKKHDDSFPIQAIQYCLKAGGVEHDGLDAVVFYEKPIDKFVRILKTYFSVAPRGLKSFLKAMPQWARRKVWIRYEIERALEEMGYTVPEAVLFSEHHESHAASAFFPSPYEEACIVTLDGVGEWPTTTIGHGKHNQIDILREQNFPHSLGLLYSAFTYYTGFTVNSGEYKVMGLAPYGNPIFTDLILDKLVSLNDDGSFLLDMSYFNFLSGLSMVNESFADLFGAPIRDPESQITQHTMDVARSIQDVTEIIVQQVVNEAHRLTSCDNLTLAGGVALNCVANSKIANNGPFKSIWIAPAAGDAGGAVGAALAAWHLYFDNPRIVDAAADTMSGSYLGPEFSAKEIESFLLEQHCEYKKLEGDDWAQTIAGYLQKGDIVALMQGRMEFGPRALGNRSILADPRSNEVQNKINRRVKFRESFRPFAPAVLEECRDDYFDLNHNSPYMLFTAPVTKSHRTDIAPDDPSALLRDRLARPRSDIPGVTHVDYSARVQTVSASTNSEFHKLLTAFKELTGCGVLVNTSFNVRGEPIVCTPEDAYRCFMNCEIDRLVLGSYVISRKGT